MNRFQAGFLIDGATVPSPQQDEKQKPLRSRYRQTKLTGSSQLLAKRTLMLSDFSTSSSHRFCHSRFQVVDQRRLKRFSRSVRDCWVDRLVCRLQIGFPGLIERQNPLRLPQLDSHQSQYSMICLCSIQQQQEYPTQEPGSAKAQKKPRQQSPLARQSVVVGATSAARIEQARQQS